jgi:hypothetical protein
MVSNFWDCWYSHFLTSVHLLFSDGTGNHRSYDCQQLTNAPLEYKLSICMQPQLHIIRAYCLMEHSYNFIFLTQEMSFSSTQHTAKICTANNHLYNNHHPVLKWSTYSNWKTAVWLSMIWTAACLHVINFAYSLPTIFIQSTAAKHNTI